MLLIRLINPGESSVIAGGPKLLDGWRSRSDNVIWVDIAGELTTADGEQLQEYFGLHPLALQDAARDRHPPKFERFDDHSFLLFKGLLASALGIDIGFGMQALVSNFVAGLIILFEKSLKVGDFVELQSGVTGEVKEINMRSTLVTTNDNVDILVPNSDSNNKEVTNWTLREAHRRIRVPFGVAYGTPSETFLAACKPALDVAITG